MQPEGNCPLSCKDIKMDNGLGDYFRLTVDLDSEFVTCDYSDPALPVGACTGTYPDDLDFLIPTKDPETPSPKPGDAFILSPTKYNAGAPGTGTGGGSAYSQVSDPSQAGSVEFIIKMEQKTADQIGFSIYSSIAPVGSDVLMTKRMDNSKLIYDPYPGGFYYLAKELHEDLYNPDFTATINIIAGGIGITETAIVMLSELLKDPSKEFARIEKINFLWSTSYFSEIEWAYTQKKTNDLVRAVSKKQGSFGAQLKVGFVVSTEPDLPGAYVPAADYTGRANEDTLADFFNLEKYPATPPGPETKWLIVGSQCFVGAFANGYVHDIFGFDMYMNLYGSNTCTFGGQGQCDDFSTDPGNKPPDNACRFGITGQNCIYQFVSDDTVGTDFAASQRPSPLMKREKPYVLEAECPTCDASNCGGCIDKPNCVQAGCTWTPGTIEGGEEVDRGTCA